MGSSAKRGGFFQGLQGGIWDRTPPTYTSNVVYMCAAGFKGPRSSNRIELSWFIQKLLHFSDFVVQMWSPWSPRHPHHPHVIPVIPTSSPYPHVVPIALRRPRCGPHGCGLVVSTPCCPCCPHCPCGPHVIPRHPHVIPIIPMLSPHCLEGTHIIPNPPDTHSTHPHHPWGVRVPNQ